jgi:hypothetical protein
MVSEIKEGESFSGDDHDGKHRRDLLMKNITRE